MPLVDTGTVTQGLPICAETADVPASTPSFREARYQDLGYSTVVADWLGQLSLCYRDKK